MNKNNKNYNHSVAYLCSWVQSEFFYLIFGTWLCKFVIKYIYIFSSSNVKSLCLIKIYSFTSFQNEICSNSGSFNSYSRYGILLNFVNDDIFKIIIYMKIVK